MKRILRNNRDLSQNLTDTIATIVNSGHWNDVTVEFYDDYDWEKEELRVLMHLKFKNEEEITAFLITGQTKFIVKDKIDEWEKRNNKSISPIIIHYGG